MTAPLLQSFENGYGVVAVSVIEAIPADPPCMFNVRCIVQEIVAPVIPDRGAPLPAHIGDEIIVPLSVGYSRAIEQWLQPFEIKPGTKYYLTLRYDPATHSYAQVQGASSVREVESFTSPALHNLQTIHGLATVEGLERHRAARRALIDPLADFEVRWTALKILRQPSPERAQAIALLRTQWTQATIDQGSGSVMDAYGDIRHIDEVLRDIDPDFTPDADARIRKWFEIIFAPFPEDLQSATGARFMADRWNAHMSQLGLLGLDAPDKVVPRIIAEMNEQSWPMQFRIGLAGALQSIDVQADEPDPRCEPALHEFYPRALAEADPWPMRLLAPLIVSGLKPPKYSVKRQFIPSPATWTAMEAALHRMRALGPGEARSAATVLVESLKQKPQ